MWPRINNQKILEPLWLVGAPSVPPPNGKGLMMEEKVKKKLPKKHSNVSLEYIRNYRMMIYQMKSCLIIWHLFCQDAFWARKQYLHCLSISIIYISAHTLKTIFRKDKRPPTLTETRTCVLFIRSTMRYLHWANDTILFLPVNYNIN